MNTKIEAMIDEAVRVEGGYGNHKHDSGGATRWGITEAVARKWGYHGKMQDLPQALARKIYREEYLEAPEFDKLIDISGSVAFEVFDTGVNCGVGTASTFLQRSLNALNLQGTLYPDLKVDGQAGAKTRAALFAYLAHRGRQGELVLLRLLNCLQGAYYLNLVERREKDESFIFGWILHRVVM